MPVIRLLKILVLLGSLSSLAMEGNISQKEWKIKRPKLTLNGREIDLGYLWFRESYVKFQVLDRKDNNQILVINLHDQIARTGMLSARLFNNWVGSRYTPTRRSIGENVLLRIFTLLSGANIKMHGASASCSWMTQANFSLLDQAIEFSDFKKEDIVFLLKNNLSLLTEIRLWISDLDNPHSPLALFRVDIDGFTEWKKAFDLQGVNLTLDRHR